MLVNFCDSCLRTDVTCSTVSSEGYEVSNLVKNCNNGFLAYPCIKPPVHIDFSFICNIEISHVIVWPQVGAQKSCGFQLSVKSSDTNNESLTIVSTAFLQKEDLGILFRRRDILSHTEISIPSNFAQQCIKAVNIINYVNRLRFSILKTDNSVPALSKIEIWGKVSPKCGKDVAMNVMALWMNRYNNLHLAEPSIIPSVDKNKRDPGEKEKDHNDLLDVPEDFLDPITFEIMTQPIILPSGKIIDQKTLEKHAHNEAIWGRPVSDPFTGVRFNDIHKPVAALPLKARIDKFLLENSNKEEIKRLPRVLGSKLIENSKSRDVINCLTVNSVNNISNVTIKTNVNQLKRSLPIEESSSTNFKKSFRGHLLPMICLRNTSTNSRTYVERIPNSSGSINKSINKTEELRKESAAVEDRLKANVKVTSMPTCKCCTKSIFYKLPCEHIICRKALLSLEKNQCVICKLEFKSSEPQRFHLCN